MSFSILVFMTSSGLAAADGDGMGGSGIGAIGHGGDVGGLEDEESGGGGAGAAGRDEDDDGDRRRFDFGDDLAGGVEQAAGGVELDEQGGGVTRCGGVDGAGDALGGDGLDGAVDAQAQDLRGGRKGCDEQQKRSEERAESVSWKTSGGAACGSSSAPWTAQTGTNCPTATKAWMVPDSQPPPRQPKLDGAPADRAYVPRIAPKERAAWATSVSSATVNYAARLKSTADRAGTDCNDGTAVAERCG